MDSSREFVSIWLCLGAVCVVGGNPDNTYAYIAMTIWLLLCSIVRIYDANKACDSAVLTANEDEVRPSRSDVDALRATHVSWTTWFMDMIGV